MQSETLAQEFARLVKEYHEGDEHMKPEAWNLLADYAVENADAISAALSDKQAGEVKIKPLEWKHDGNGSFANCGVTDTRWVANNAEERAKADATRASRIRSALVDVPAVEPVAWLPADDAPRGVYALIKHRSGQLDLCYKTDNGEPFLETWRYAGTAKRGEQAPWPESYIPVSDLRTSPPLREGEDSAEVIPVEPTDEMIEAGEEEIASRRQHGCRIYAADIWSAMVAATRSASATTAKGGRNDG
ncbi:hypothetical protein [Shinella sp.]|uniref:hypothetical protein n=1 Tax=Shinella sp. TaxID=1870904 RepID=UPI00289C0AC4|nr:hypothetical protein [Shinella sp.]